MPPPAVARNYHTVAIPMMGSDQERILEAEIYRFVRFSYEIVYDGARKP